MTYDNVIEMDNVSKRLGDFLIDDMTLTLPKGCILGLVGENGAGKTSTIRLIMNSLLPDEGQIRVMDMENTSTGFTDLKNRIGVVLDDAYFPYVVNAERANRIMKSAYREWDEKTYFDYVEKFGLPMKKRFKDYSRGMKMKLAAAVALSHKADLLILDEATAGLDPVMRNELTDMLYDFTRDENHSILISSHITTDLEKLCDYIAFIHKGKLILCEEKDRLLESRGIIRCGKDQADDIPEDAVIGSIRGKYGMEYLVERDKVSPVFQMEKPSIEDIMLYMVKGEKRI